MGAEPGRGQRHLRQAELGFTLVELMAIMALTGILMTLGAGAVRNFWLVRSLEAGKDQVISEMRGLQQRVTSETHPLVYGARFRAGASSIGLVRYNVLTGACAEYATRALEGGVVVGAADFAEPAFIATCRAATGGSDEYVFFYARGSATEGLPAAGKGITLNQPSLGRTTTLGVVGITGRVVAP
ncbi:MAG: prepilin-type N-terminal cleavage/methylation domain-containing protein [Actinobacteria bacterium]|nr:prepilin-type N-terminal cleavage/methylation domain-containing protein [Actinomycetota bacterium]